MGDGLHTSTRFYGDIRLLLFGPRFHSLMELSIGRLVHVFCSYTKLACIIISPVARSGKDRSPIMPGLAFVIA